MRVRWEGFLVDSSEIVCVSRVSLSHFLLFAKNLRFLPSLSAHGLQLQLQWVSVGSSRRQG